MSSSLVPSTISSCTLYSNCAIALSENISSYTYFDVITCPPSVIVYPSYAPWLSSSLNRLPVADVFAYTWTSLPPIQCLRSGPRLFGSAVSSPWVGGLLPSAYTLGRSARSGVKPRKTIGCFLDLL